MRRGPVPHSLGRRSGAAGLAALFFWLFPLLALSQEVTVTTETGGLALSGTVLGYDGEFLRLQTEDGEVTLDYAAVTCEGAACPDPESHVPVLRIAGAKRMGDVLVPALLEAYARARSLPVDRRTETPETFSYRLGPEESPLLRIAFSLSSTEAAIAAMIDRRADLVMADREATPEEIERVRRAGLGELNGPGQSRILARDALVPIVSASNPVDDLSLGDLGLAIAGEAASWRALGDGGLAPTIHLPSEDDGEMQQFRRMVLEPLGLSPAEEATIHETPTALAAAVAEEPGAIGLVPYLSYGDAQPLTLTGPCGLSISADATSLKTEDYPLSTPLFLYEPMRRLPEPLTDFLAWTQSDAAQAVVRRAGFVDQSPEEIPVAAQGERFAGAIAAAGEDVTLEDLQRMLKNLRPMRRLSITFRFEEASTDLDAQSRANVLQLARALRQGDYDDRALLLAGFTDGVGPAYSNRRLARERARSVREEVVSALGGGLPEEVILRTGGFGEALPIGCDSTSWGRRMNRRVELWVGD